MENLEKWISEIDQAVSRWNTVYHDEAPYRLKQDARSRDDFLIFLWPSGFLFITPEKYEKLSKTNKAKLERLKLFGKWK